jgi:hypothetical protein
MASATTQLQYVKLSRNNVKSIRIVIEMTKTTMWNAGNITLILIQKEAQRK